MGVSGRPMAAWAFETVGVTPSKVKGSAVQSAARTPSMSALGQKQTSWHLQPMSALPPKADIGTQPCDVCFVPKADIRQAANSSLFDHLVGAGKQRLRHGEAE